MRLVIAASLAAMACVLVTAGARLHRSTGQDFATPTLATARPASTAATPAPTTQRQSHAQAPGVPTSVLLNAIGVTAAIDPVRSIAGQLAVPDDPSRLGWWIASRPAGSTTGSTVVDGHVDSATTGPGALYRLTDVSAGQSVTVQVAGGGHFVYRVESRKTYPKSSALPRALFATTGPPRLVLITCGGSFDAQTRSYESNVVVVALLDS